ncbi:hypothetical protein KBW71_03390 [Hydrogenophaga aromaticivorans]|uniref:hypothetical protein n=1 Tax=Hydrogenophaga aromaticivorans TaxID=2610898 RepID=UPI001B35B4B6|nr:hypothetical protein [Hydrogenophaga aromaticivorans]MBQ0917473.1 hypothetical protein [Hydrogenophaga aromaticivorans]
MTQFLMASFGLTSLWFAMGRNLTLRKWAPVVGLAGQPFWFAFSLDAGAWGLLVLVAAYTLVYLRGALIQWGVV